MKWFLQQRTNTLNSQIETKLHNVQHLEIKSRNNKNFKKIKRELQMQMQLVITQIREYQKMLDFFVLVT